MKGAAKDTTDTQQNQTSHQNLQYFFKKPIGVYSRHETP